jgi:hypothetical protein
VRQGKIKAHKSKMILLYLGALVIAGGFTFVPGSYMHELFFGNYAHLVFKWCINKWNYFMFIEEKKECLVCVMESFLNE